MRLFLCEKPSQGKDIGRILGATQRGEGCFSGSGVTVTWCIGHLVEAAAPEVYDAALKRWSLEQLPIIPQQWRVEVKPKTATQFKVVKALLAKATHLVIATDADREGELIAREIIDLCGYRGPVERLWLSALNDASIRTALGKLARLGFIERRGGQVLEGPLLDVLLDYRILADRVIHGTLADVLAEAGHRLPAANAFELAQDAQADEDGEE